MKYILLITNLLISLALIVVSSGFFMTDKPLLGLSVMAIAAISLPWEDKWRPEKLKASTLKTIKVGLGALLIVAGFSAIQARKNMLAKQQSKTTTTSTTPSPLPSEISGEEESPIPPKNGLILLESGKAVHKMKPTTSMQKLKNSRVTISTPVPVASGLKIAKPKAFYLTPMDLKKQKKPANQPVKSTPKPNKYKKTIPIRAKRTAKPKPKKKTVKIKSNPKSAPKPAPSTKPTTGKKMPIAIPTNRLPLGSKSTWPTLNNGLNQPIPVPTLTIPTLSRTSKEEMPPMPPVPSF